MFFHELTPLLIAEMTGKVIDNIHIVDVCIIRRPIGIGMFLYIFIGRQLGAHIKKVIGCLEHAPGMEKHPVFMKLHVRFHTV
jgi:hypothetical protein